MNRQPVLILMLATLVLAPSPARCEPDLQPGLWEITTTMEMPGMAFKMPAATVTQCITPEAMVPQTVQGNDKCRMLDNRVDGDVVTWTVRCDSAGGSMTSQGAVVYQGDRFEGTVTTTGSQMPAAMTQAMTGKHVGPCK